MPFQKGRTKTGGRKKGVPARKAVTFVGQLKDAGFNYVKELADTLKCLKDLRTNATDQKKDPDAYVKALELKFFYGELKSLLPYMAPKLREKEVETIDEPEIPGGPQKPISDEDLLKALGNGTETPTLPRTSNKTPLGAGNPKPQVPTSANENLSDLAGEQEEDS
jgi:hypothetical protein